MLSERSIISTTSESLCIILGNVVEVDVVVVVVEVDEDVVEELTVVDVDEEVVEEEEVVVLEAGDWQQQGSHLGYPAHGTSSHQDSVAGTQFLQQ